MVSRFSEYVPDWVYCTLLRDCLIMLLEGALKHMPQEADVVARCMRALAPLSLEEYEQCFRRLSSEAPGVSGSAPTARPPAVDMPDASASASNVGWEHVPPAQHHESVMQAIDQRATPMLACARYELLAPKSKRSLMLACARYELLAPQSIKLLFDCD